MPRIIAMIPARLGSKRVKNKNLRLLGGKPLIAHVIEKAKQSGVFDDIYINSEATIFEKIAGEYGVKFYKRPEVLASDTATNDQFVLDFIQNTTCDYIIQINPTSPLLSVEDIRNFVTEMVEGGYETFHGTKKEQIEGLFKGVSLNFEQNKTMPPSQSLEPVYLFSSGIMGWKVDAYYDLMNRFGCATYGGDGKIGYFTLSGYSTIDIDHEEDFCFAEMALMHQQNPDQYSARYYGQTGERDEVDVPYILAKDGVVNHYFDQENQFKVNIHELISQRPFHESWSYRVINTENNSATLICQMPGEGNRLHYHRDWNEWWYIVDGNWEWEIEGEKIIVNQGDVVFIPKGNWHKITAVGDKPAIRLAVSRDLVAHIYKNEEG